VENASKGLTMKRLSTLSKDTWPGFKSGYELLGSAFLLWVYVGLFGFAILWPGLLAPGSDA
jgi:hypothetical protein